MAIVTDEGASLFAQRSLAARLGDADSLMFEANERRFLGLSKASASPFNPFSDLNQWILKVLLAREISPDLLKAPRDPIYSGS